MGKDFADKLIPLEQGLKALQESTGSEFSKIRADIANDSRWQIGHGYLQS